MKITKKTVYLFIFFIIGFIIRIIAAANTDVSTDEMIYSIIPLNIISADKLGTVEQSILFFYLNDISYKIFGGITPISIRFWSILFGSLTVFTIFLLSKDLFRNEKTAYLSSFLFAISGYAINYNYEMDMIAFFFLSLSMLFFIKYMNDKKNSLYLSVIFFALALLIKTLVAAFLPGYIIMWLWHMKRKDKTAKIKELKIVSLALLLGLIIISPVLIYNYFTVTKLGISDYYVSNILGIGETVHQGLQGKPWAFSNLWNNAKILLERLIKFDGLILITGLLGIITFTKKNKISYQSIGSLFVLISTVIFFIYLAGQNGSPTHYLQVPLILSLYSGYFIFSIKQNIWKKFSYLAVITAVAFALIAVNSSINSSNKSITLELRNYVHKNIPDNAVVVIDPRIYRGIHAWVFNDKHYLDGSHFAELAGSISKHQGETILAPLYYIECITGSNCGWKPEDFARIFDQGESISNYFKENTKKVAEIRTTHNFDIHKGTITIPLEAYEAIDRTHQFWFYPVGWKHPETAVDYYEVSGSNQLVQGFGFLILWVDIILAILSIPFLLYYVFRHTKTKDIS